MPEPRPLQTYSTLLEDRRIIEAAAEAREPPSLVIHLLDKEWSIRPGRTQNVNGPGARRFSYSQPISGLLDDIQARRIPTEFTDIFKKAEIKFFEGCLLVEMHDSRPTKGTSIKNPETRVDKYILRPTSESLWADIRSIVDNWRGWGDKEALELEARIVLSTAPSLCLDPSPTVNRMANVIARSGADPSITSFKRKQSEDVEDDIESIKRRKLVQMMNPNFGKAFEPKFKILAARQAGSQKTHEGPLAVAAPKIPPPPARQVPQNPSNAVPAGMLQVQQLANAQATQIAQQRIPGLTTLKVPPNAQQAALLMQQRNKFANATQQQQFAMAQAARNAAMANNMAGAMPQAPNNGNAATTPLIKMEQDPVPQTSSLQNGKTPFALSMPPVAKRPNTATIPSSASPPKPSMPVPPSGTPQRPVHSLENVPPATNTPAVMQTPRQQPATPQAQAQPMIASQAQPVAGAPGQQPGMMPASQLASYHQGLVNGQQNQLHNVVQGANGYPNPGGMRPVYPGAGNTYTMNGAVVGRPPMLQQQMGQMTQMGLMQQQMMQSAYQQMNMGGFAQPLQSAHPHLQQQMLQMQQMHQQATAAVAAGNIYAAANGIQVNAAQAQAHAQQQAHASQVFQTQLWNKVDATMEKMPPGQLVDLVSKAPDQVKLSPAWAAANDREKARMTLFNLFRQKFILERRNAVAAQNAANAQR